MALVALENISNIGLSELYSAAGNPKNTAYFYLNGVLGGEKIIPGQEHYLVSLSVRNFFKARDPEKADIIYQIAKAKYVTAKDIVNIAVDPKPVL